MKLQHATTAITRRGREKNREERHIFFLVCAKLGVYLSWCREITSVLYRCHVRCGSGSIVHTQKCEQQWRQWWRRQRQNGDYNEKVQSENGNVRVRARNGRKKIMIFVKQASAHLTSIIHVQWNKSDQDVVGKSGGKMWLSYLPPNTIHNDT